MSFVVSAEVDRAGLPVTKTGTVDYIKHYMIRTTYSSITDVRFFYGGCLIWTWKRHIACCPQLNLLMGVA
jgi:hypothetical protein